MSDIILIITDLTKLQRVLNRLARVVTKSPPFTRSVPLLSSLHWLPVKYRVHFKICLLNYKALQEEQPFTFAPWLPFLFHHVHWDQTEESLWPPLGSRPTLAQGPSAHVPLLFGTTFHYLSIQPPRLPPSEDVSKHTFSTWPFPRRHRCALLPVDVTEWLHDFAFEHRSGCCATEPGYAGDIGAIEIWLIDWLKRSPPIPDHYFEWQQVPCIWLSSQLRVWSQEGRISAVHWDHGPKRDIRYSTSNTGVPLMFQMSTTNVLNGAVGYNTPAIFA